MVQEIYGGARYSNGGWKSYNRRHSRGGPARKGRHLAEEAPDKLGRYEIVRTIGKGAMGVVYEGRDPKIGRRVAIKTCRADLMENTGLKNELLLRFEREFQAAGALQHPYIITIFDVGEDAGMPYIAMEYVEGHDLRHVIEQRGAHEIPALAEMAAKVCEGLHHAHLHGTIHRDIKPGNVLLTPRGGVKIADFGIARVANSVLTIDGSVVGTPHYMSPEQFAGDELDGRADLFSVGIVLYEMLTGRRPFAGETVSTLMHEVLRRAPALPSAHNPAVPPALDSVVLKALAKYPNDRFANGDEMAAALRAAVGHAPHKAPTMIGGIKPEAPTPAPTLPRTTGSESTLKPKPATSAQDEIDVGHSRIWPVAAVVVFGALVLLAAMMLIRVDNPAQGQPTPTPAATPGAP